MPAAPAPSVAKPPPPKGTWRGQLNVGIATTTGTRNQQDYFGQVQLTYEQAYASNPKKFFRNTAQLDGEYQRTGGDVSANRANVNNKSDFDIGDNVYGYLNGGGGFDRVRRIDAQYQVGAGLGWHWIRRETVVVNLESGYDYLAQRLSNAPDLDTHSLRLAENLTWSIAKNVKLTQRLAVYPSLDQAGEGRGVFNVTLSYGFWKNLTLNLIVTDNYNTQVAPGVNRNELQTRLTLGVTF